MVTDKLKQDLIRKRSDLQIIMDIIPDAANVLDLGCGDGSLLKILRLEKNVRGCGIEVSQEKIIESVANGVPVIHQDLNEGLKDFPSDFYDFIILSQTLQAVKRPDILLDEMLRVGKQAVISFINFGFFITRLQLITSGRMPVTRTLPDPWYNTPNIHLATIHDFRSLCKEKEINIVKEVPIGRFGNILADFLPNLFAMTCVFVISKKENIM